MTYETFVIIYHRDPMCKNTHSENIQSSKKKNPKNQYSGKLGLKRIQSTKLEIFFKISSGVTPPKSMKPS